MATKTEFMKSNPSTHPASRVKLSIWIAALALMVTLVLIVTFAWVNPSKGESLTSSHAALETISRRYQAMAERYAVRQNSGSLQALEILSDRYQALADAYTLAKVPAHSRSLEIISVRYQGQADIYTKGIRTETVRALTILSDRYQAQADRYLNK